MGSPTAGRRPKRGWRRTVGLSLVAALMAAVGVLATAPAAHAATPKCDGWAFVQGTHLFDWDIVVPAVSTMPVKHFGGGWDEIKCEIRYGDVGWQVKRLQQTLNGCYGWLGIKLTVDGHFGTNTKNALIKAQKNSRITADGVYGPKTATTISHPKSTYTMTNKDWFCAPYRP
ncbi:peptidoglycan-binding domain-containing protein [Catellatospora sp. NPDC049133]|uniref:peptidoglycan-binding domain-containing protein n=1 Tax=Catellatospora sp. NPDC049133 TaxID=3155499 RepID=UPI0033F1EB0C